MPIDLAKIDELINTTQIRFEEAGSNLNNLKFVREKLLYGTDDEKKLIALMAKLTIDNINGLIEAFRDDVTKILNR